jgi:uncharacterized protein (TIGR03067 family)
MRSVALATLAVVLSAVPLTAQDAQDDRQKIQGTWALKAMEIGGKNVLEDKDQAKALQNFTVVITAERITVQFSKEEHHEASYKLAPARNPKELDLTFLEGRDKGKTSPAIYKLEGDTLTLCGTDAGQPRPTEFKTRPGGKETFMVFQRVKP